MNKLKKYCQQGGYKSDKPVIYPKLSKLEIDKINQSNQKRLFEQNQTQLLPYNYKSENIQNIGKKEELNRKINERQNKTNLLGLALSPVPVIGEIYNAGNAIANTAVDLAQGEYEDALLSGGLYGLNKIPFNKLNQFKSLKVDKYDSEIDWNKWNKEIPKNKKLLKEYNKIEQEAKLNGTWMKDSNGNALRTPDGNLATPEQFIQLNSNRGKEFLGKDYEKINQVYRGAYSKTAKKNLKPGEAVFTANKDLAQKYATYTKNDIPETLTPNSKYHKFSDYFSDKNDFGGVFNLAHKKSPKSFEFTGNGDNWVDINLNKVAVDKNLSEFQKMKNFFIDRASTNGIAQYIEKNKLDYAKLNNIFDGGIGDVSIINHKKGNYLKSLVGNNGNFDLNNSNVFKSIIPLAGASAIYNSNKQQGGDLIHDLGHTLSERRKQYLDNFQINASEFSNNVSSQKSLPIKKENLYNLDVIAGNPNINFRDIADMEEEGRSFYSNAINLPKNAVAYYNNAYLPELAHSYQKFSGKNNIYGVTNSQGYNSSTEYDQNEYKREGSTENQAHDFIDDDFFKIAKGDSNLLEKYRNSTKQNVIKKLFHPSVPGVNPNKQQYWDWLLEQKNTDLYKKDPINYQKYIEKEILEFPKEDLIPKKAYGEIINLPKKQVGGMNKLKKYCQEGGNFAKSGIYIKPSHKGLFTAKANRAGKGVQEYAHYVKAHKENFPSSTIKQATFAINASKWKKQVGGDGGVIAEAGEFYKDEYGNVHQINPDTVSHDDYTLIDEDGNYLAKTPYNKGGVAVQGVQNVLSASHENRDKSDKSYTEADEEIRIKPKEGKEFGKMFNFGKVNFNGGSPSKLYDSVLEAKARVLKKYNKQNYNEQSPYGINSSKANADVLSALPEDELIYDYVYDLQESKKTSDSDNFQQGGSILKSDNRNDFKRWLDKKTIGFRNYDHNMSQAAKEVYNTYDKQFPTILDKVNSISALASYTPSPIISVPANIINMGIDTYQGNGMELGADAFGTVTRLSPYKRVNTAGKFIQGLFSAEDAINKPILNKKQAGGKGVLTPYPQMYGNRPAAMINIKGKLYPATTVNDRTVSMDDVFSKDSVILDKFKAKKYERIKK